MQVLSIRFESVDNRRFEIAFQVLVYMRPVSCSRRILDSDMMLSLDIQQILLCFIAATSILIAFHNAGQSYAVCRMFKMLATSLYYQ